MKSWSWRRVTGLAGIVYVVLFVALAVGIGDGPSITDSATDIRRWFEENETEVALFTWGVALAVGVFFLLFASGLRSLLGPADTRSEGVWSRLSFAGAVLMVATAFGGLAFWAVLAQQDILAVASDETVQTLNAFDTVIFFAIINWGQAVFLLGASVVIIQSGVIARWIGWLGGVVALLNVVAALWTFTGDNGGFWGAVGAVAFVGFLIWTLAAAISMVRSGGGDGTPAPAHP